ncbi:uncharacterized protein LOC126670572 isoform X2 [Mercurialis annua]|uniref:uncharacterized protein LOC126670572 isoform X2 n=1 Tax=Mercurialis annua TaxID=3986 RepID=UPI00215F23F4|nr:uncharacterized protein LOC126670572 isoform X2 [Mercurialis annua]
MDCVSSPSLFCRIFSTSSCTFRRTRTRQGNCIFTSQTTTEEKQQRSSNVGKAKSDILEESFISKSPISEADKLPPLVKALKASAAENAASFHFPGHNRGRAAPSSLAQLIGLRPFIHDLPELPELDNLFSPEGPILEAQILASELFGSRETWFLVGGTTCGIQAAIMATCSPGEYLILPRNSHLSAVSAMVLSGAIPKYMMPEYDHKWDIAGEVTPSQVKKSIRELEMEGHKAAAVFVTSPTYHGICSNLSEISQICHSYGVALIVDEAHGAHLGFHAQMPPSALKQDTDLVVQSTHKVLCSLTQSSMLHMSGKLVDRERICRCLQMLQSTSPSYLLLASLDAARAQIAENPETVFEKAMELAIEAKILIKQVPGISLLEHPSSMDPLRLTVGFWQLGLSGYNADDYLCRNHQVISELVGTQSITFAINLGTSKEHVERLVSGLKDLSSSLQGKNTKGGSINRGYLPFADISMRLNPRDAFFATKKRVNIRESVGEVCGELICPYPPGIPVMIPGEVITGSALSYLLDVQRKGAIITGASDPLLSSIVVCST